MQKKGCKDAKLVYNSIHNLNKAKGNNMKLSTAIKRLEKAGYEVKGNLGSYDAMKGGVIISFFETSENSDDCSRFTYDSTGSCAPTYGLTLKAAMN